MHSPGSTLTARFISALVLAGGLCVLSAGDVRTGPDGLTLGGRRFFIRGIDHRPSGPAVSCLYARDLPLIAATGANTVRTLDFLSPDEKGFVPLLHSTGLYWLAGFPLNGFYDASRPVASRRDEILAAFESYAKRFKGESRLLGYVFGNDVLENYNSHFSGSTSEFFDLLLEASVRLEALEPGNTPLLALEAPLVSSLQGNPAGLSFWVFDIGRSTGLASTFNEIRRSAPNPVLIAGGGVAAEDEANETLAIRELAKEVESGPVLSGGILAAFADAAKSSLFRSRPGEQNGFDTLQPRALFGNLAGLWGGRSSPAWQLKDPPHADSMRNAASGELGIAQGSLVKLAGTNLDYSEFAANGIPWPLHLGEFSLCVGGRPAPLARVSGSEVLAQIPWDLAPGDQEAVVYRAGVASDTVRAEVRQYAPGIFPGGVVRTGTYCSASAENGVRAGEILEVYATGLGPGTPSFVMPDVYINGTPAEVFYSGAMLTLVGMNQVNLRVNPLTPPSKETSLELRVEGVASNRYPISVVDMAGRPGISLQTPPIQLVLQAGGPAKVVEIRAEGTNGYCGPVLLAAPEGALGLSVQSPVGYTGTLIPVQVSATATAYPRSNSAMILQGYAPGTAAGKASLAVTVLPNRGDIEVRVISGGYQSYPVARVDWNQQPIFHTSGGGAGRGINVVAADPSTGLFSSGRNFDTWGDKAASARLVQYLSALPTGTLVLFAAADDGSLLLRPQDRDAIAAMFGSRSVRTLGYQQSWAMMARKGAAVPIAEAVSTKTQVVLERKLRFPLP